MKAITLYQPWASLVASGAKTVETRSWSTPYRGPLAIHAAVAPMRSARDVHGLAGCFCPGEGGIPEALVSAFEIAETCPVHGALVSEVQGCIVATCVLDDVVTAETLRGDPYGDFSPGRFAWLLRAVQALSMPVPVRGRQGLWEWDDRNVLFAQ